MKKMLSLLLALLLLAALCGCGSVAYQNTAGAAPEPVAAAPAAGNSFGGFAMSESYMLASDASAEIAFDAEMDAPAGVSGAALPDIDPEKIIYSANATVETTDFDGTLARLQELVQSFGGFVESSSLNGSNYYSQARGNASTRSAEYSLRVPSSRFSELMGSLSTLGNVPYTSTYTENISAQYYDLNARLEACRTQETRLLEMMEKAETVSDIVVIEDRLTELRYQIESMQSTLNGWDRQVSYSSVYLSVREVTVYTPEAKLSYGQELALALRNGLRSAGQFLKDLLVFLVEALPTLLILVPLVWLIVFVIVRLIRRRKRKKAEKRAAALQQAEIGENEN